MPLGDRDEEKYDNRLQLVILLIIPNGKTARANVMANLTSLNILPNTKVFVAAENGSTVEALELVTLFLLKTGTFGDKTC